MHKRTEKRQKGWKAGGGVHGRYLASLPFSFYEQHTHAHARAPDRRQPEMMARVPWGGESVCACVCVWERERGGAVRT